jgi:hypothetical protein
LKKDCITAAGEVIAGNHGVDAQKSGKIPLTFWSFMLILLALKKPFRAVFTLNGLEL